MAQATRGLAVALARHGHRVHAISESTDLGGLELWGIGRHAVVVPPPSRPAAVAREPVADHLAYAAAVHRQVAEIHEREGVDVVVAPLWCCEGAVCLLDDRFPTVVSCVTSMTTLERLRGGASDDPEPHQLAALERATMARTRYVHGLTRSSLDDTLADFGTEPAQAGIVGRGVADRAERGWPGGSGAAEPEILFVGRLERRKGVDVLLRAARAMVAAGERFSLTLAGPDSPDTETGEPYRVSFERDAAADPALAARVRFAGPVADAELLDLYRRADVVCVPSRYESHGVVLVEAMMFGKPIVACAAGGVPEVVEDGGNALLAPPDDPEALAERLRRLLGDPALRAAYGARSRALYEERFEAMAVGARMADFLRRVSASHPRSGAPTDDLSARLAAVVSEVLPVGRPVAAEAADELLSPSATAWRAAALRAGREHSAWQARALEAERQLDEWRDRAIAAEGAVAGGRARAGANGSARGRLTRPLRRAAAALRRREP